MKARPPAQCQLELLPRRSVLALSVVEQSARHEILLHAAEATRRKEVRDETR